MAHYRCKKTAALDSTTTLTASFFQPYHHHLVDLNLRKVTRHIAFEIRLQLQGIHRSVDLKHELFRASAVSENLEQRAKFVLTICVAGIQQAQPCEFEI